MVTKALKFTPEITNEEHGKRKRKNEAGKKMKRARIQVEEKRRRNQERVRIKRPETSSERFFQSQKCLKASIMSPNKHPTLLIQFSML